LDSSLDVNTKLVSTISVLLVDDEEALLGIGKSFLEMTKEFQVTTAQSASVALSLLRSNGIQAIVSDYQMPEMDGIEFLKKVREADKHIPFIMFTGRGREEIAIQAFENGADFYIQKGGDPKAQFAELVHKIHAAVNHRKAQALNITLNRLYTVLSATNQVIVHIHDKKELLSEICRIVVDIGGFRMAWAGFVNEKKHLIEPVASYGYIDGYLDTIAISTDPVPRGRGPTGTAFREKTFNFCNDVATAPKMAPWRDGALQRGYRSLAAFPFAADTKNAGVITFYASEPGFFDDQIIRLLEEQSGDITYALAVLDHEEKQISAEHDLKASELRYRRLFETAQDAILILDGESGEIIDANRFILDMLGYPLEYFVGKHLWELGFFKDKALAKNAFTELKTNGYIRYEDLPLETRDGRSIDVEFVSNVYFVGDNRIIQCNIRDITDRKVGQDILKASELRYRRLFETAQDAILILDGESGEIIDANRFILDMLGYPLEYFVGKRLWELGFIKDKTLAKNAFTELKTNGYIRYEDLPLETRDGRSIDVEFVSNVYLVDDKKIIQCNIRDITDRKVAQALLQSSETCYRRLFESAQDGILIIDEKTGKIVDANPYILNLLGYPLEYFVDKHLWELGFFKDKSLAKNAFTELKTVGYIRYEDLPLQTRDGQAIHVEFISNVYPVNRRKIIQCNIRDITERKHTGDALALANRKLNLLSNITRHDIINQLTGLMAYLTMSEEMVSNGALKEFIGKEITSAQAIQRLINFTKDYEDMGVNAPAWQNVSTCIRNITKSLPLGDVSVTIDNPDVEVFADPLLEKVFYNLVDNALKYGGDKMTTIRVILQEENGSLILTIADDGIGIPMEDKSRLFVKGFGKNTGLGLFLSREILSITEIKISENGEPGTGAQFVIVVPKDGYRFIPDESKK
jgi:PAS domain S-box-containing protein